MSPAVADMGGPDIPGFRWVCLLGQGGFADVFLYRQELPSRDVAVKVMRAQGDMRGTGELRREAGAMALLSGHPSAVELHGVRTTTGGQTYLVMEYCPVANLLTQVRARPTSLEDTLGTIIKICDVVETFHWRGHVHRDIKPLNIMMDAYGKPVLADFGVASRVGTLEIDTFGGFSVLRVPPEQQDMTAPVLSLQDMWALASTTWTFMTERSPFEDPIDDNSTVSIANRVQHGRMRGLGRADAPCELERVLRVATAVDPAERTPPAKKLGRGLQRVQEEIGYPRTEVEIKGKRSKVSVTVAGDQETRLRGTSIINPDATWLRSATYLFEGEVGSGGVEAVADSWKNDRSEDVDEASARRVAEGSLETKETISPLAGVLLALLAALIVAGLVVGILCGQGSLTRIAPDPEKTSTSTAPGDALGVAPPKVSNLAGGYSDGAVAWTWTAPEGPTPSDIVYAYEGSGAVGRSRSRVESTSVTVDRTGGENCIKITTVSHSSRHMSSPVRVCVEVP